MRGLRWCLNTIKPTSAAPRVRPDSPCSTSKSVLEQSVQDAAAQEGGYSWDDMPQHVLEVIFLQVWESTHPSVRHKVGLRLCRVCRRWRHMVQHMFFISPWAAAPAMVHPLQLTTLCPAGLGPPGMLRGYVVRQPAALGLPGRRLLLTFHAGSHPGSGKFLLAARPGSSGSGVAWSITCDRRGEGPALALLRANLLATSYTLAPGLGPTRGGTGAGADTAARCPPNSSISHSTSLAVQYRLGMRGMTLPRRVHVLLDATEEPSSKAAYCCGSSSELAAAQQSVPRGTAAAAAVTAAAPPAWGHRCRPLLLENRRPHWNEGLRCWCLNFKGRVKLASIKNFQLQLVGNQQGDGAVPAGGDGQQPPPPQEHLEEVEDQAQQEEEQQQEQEQDLQEQEHQQAQPVAGLQLLGFPAAGAHPLTRVTPPAGPPGGIRRGGLVLQFGKVEEHLYVLDYAPHLMTAVEAFATALTSFDSKMLM